MFICGCMSTYYNLLLAYSINYLVESFKTPLPWEVPEGSNKPWNDDYFYHTFLNASSGYNEMGKYIYFYY